MNTQSTRKRGTGLVAWVALAVVLALVRKRCFRPIDEFHRYASMLNEEDR